MIPAYSLGATTVRKYRNALLPITEIGLEMLRSLGTVGGANESDENPVWENLDVFYSEFRMIASVYWV